MLNKSCWAKVGWWMCAMAAVAWAPLSARAEDVKADLATLTAARYGLLDQLEKRQAADALKGPAQDYHLVLDEGADRNPMNVVLRRRGGAWASAYSEVPGWMQSTMQEYRGFFLGNGVGGAWRNILRFPADCSGLKIENDRLGGAMDVQFRLDQTLDEKLPPGSPVSWWDRFIPSGMSLTRKQSFTLDAAIQKDAYVFDLVLDRGVYWDPAWSTPKADKKAKQPAAKGPGITRRPIYVRLQAPCSRFTIARVQTPTWNGGHHEGDATGLKIENGRLTGVLLVMLHQDGWMPFGGGKTTQHDPLIVKFDVDARLEHHVLTGEFKATVSGKYEGLHYTTVGDGSMKTDIPETKYSGEITGRGGRAVLGRYQARGDLGETTGMVSGMLIDDPVPARELVKQPSKPPGDDASQVALQASAMMHQIRALHLANQHYPLPLDEALAQTDIAMPEWGEAVDAAQAAAYVREAARCVASMAGPSEKLPVAMPEDNGHSPSEGAVAMPLDGTVNVLRAGTERQWLFAKSWQLLGPFEQRQGIDNNNGMVPDVLCVEGMKYVQRSDRFGATLATPRSAQWTPASFESPRLGFPSEKLGFFIRFAGEAWFAASKVRSDAPRKVWLSLESNDFAKLWVNGKLVWADYEKPWRYRERQRAVVAVTLEAGENQFLARVHRDRRISWMRLALTTQDPGKGPAMQTGPVPSSFIFPQANPPLAWDIDKGINVAWRDEKLGGNSRPVVAGDALLVSAHPCTLHCIDAASGKDRWKVDVTQPDLLPHDIEALHKMDPKSKERAEAIKALQAKGLPINDLKDLRMLEPAFDGQFIYANGAAGVVGCYDLSGKPKWTHRSNLTRARVHLYKNLVIVHGLATGGWPNAKIDPRAKERTVGVLVVDAASGEPRHQITLSGSYHESMSNLVVLRAGEKEAPALMCGADTIIDVLAGKVLPPVDLDLPPGAGSPGGAAGYGAVRSCGFSANADTVFWTLEEQSVAVRMWLAPSGQIAYGHRWESNYEHGGFGSFYVPCLATEKYLFGWCPVLERGPHCPDSRLDLTVQDAATGRPIARLKPALGGVLHAINPVIAGPYIYCLDSGGGPFAPMQTHGQLVVATADDKVQMVCQNLIELGTNQSPVFAGERMYLRSPKSLTCIAVTTKEGREYQAKALARTALIAIGTDPAGGSPKAVEPMPPAAPAPTIPVGKLMDQRATDAWIGVGPFAPGKIDDAALAALRPQAGSELVADGKKLTFSPLSRKFAYNEPPKYLRISQLQGTGDIIPHFMTRVDPRCVSGPAGEGLIYTVVDNTRDRVVIPTLKSRGVSMWLAGQPIKPDEALHLKPGLYPFLVRIDPAYYQDPPKATDLPVAIGKALAAKAIDPIDWPHTWKIVGPIPPDAPPLAEADLRAMPGDTVRLDDQDYPVFDFPVSPADKNNVMLASLIDLQPGQKPDVKNPPKSVKIAIPSVAYAFATVDCPADGYLYVTAGADWYMTWYLDGHKVYDTSKDGNNAAPTNIDAHPFSLKVTKGKHVVAVLVKPGTAGWSFGSAAAFSTKGPDQLTEFKVQPRQAFEARDLRLVPAFKEIPHPPTRRAQWLGRIRSAEPRLRMITKDIPGTPEARAADAMLREAAR